MRTGDTRPSAVACGSQTSTLELAPGVPSSKLARTAALATLVGFALAISSAAPAEAARQWTIGTSERSTVLNCTSVVLGEPYAEPGAMADAAWFVDKRKLPRVGDVFYVRTFFGAVGRPCVEQSAAVEVVLPRGVRLAISRRNPVRCRSIDPQSGRVTRLTSRQGCPRRAGRGVYGRSLGRTGSRGPLWALPFGQAFTIEVPLRSSRPLRGAPPECDRRRQLGHPCPPREAGDGVQFGVKMSDGYESPWLSPYMPLIVRKVTRRR